ncbi:MAG: hypothetical protein DRP84_02740 [Spirochaetes bacterium]|nr:MAG: hypothetical protein DRP84_02740 [Spirochaetota bacterium]
MASNARNNVKNPKSKTVLIFQESFRRFYRDRCDVEARSLSFITILLIVPFFLVSILSLKFFSFYSSLEKLLIGFVSNFFLPEKGRKIITYLDSFQYQTASLNILNVSLLLLVSFWLFFMITTNVNRIWKNKRRASLFIYIVKYVIFILITPTLLVFSFYFRNSSLINDYYNLGLRYFQYGKMTSVLLSILINWLLIFLLYFVIPHGKIRFKYTLISALITAAVLWITRYGYNFFLKKMPQINIIYGSLSFIPIFLIWIYMSWIIVLYGLELNYSFHFYNN